MLITKAYKIKLYPNKEQEQELLKIAGASRFVWNYYLAKRIKQYEKNKKSISYAKLSRDLTKLRRKTDWVKETNADILGASLRNLDRTYTRFFKKVNGFPNFKAKKDKRQSFIKKSDWRIIGNKVSITKNLVIRFRGTIDSKTPKKQIVVFREPSGKWYLTAFYKNEIKSRKRFAKPIGIDLGLKHLAITSEGKKYDAVPNLTFRLAILQRILSRKKNGSRRRERAKVAVTRMYERIANVRSDHTHKVSHAITSENHAAIVCEDLNVKGMMVNHKLANSIANANWNELVRQLEYKQKERGGKFIKVGRFFPSSKTCFNCEVVRDKLPLNIREWECSCGSKLDRDINAARNILKEGLRNSPAWRTQVRRNANVL
jgi:putative transposase